MRHRVGGRKLNRTSSHRLALRRNLVQSLFEHGEVRTTVIKTDDPQRTLPLPSVVSPQTVAVRAASTATVRLAKPTKVHHRFLQNRQLGQGGPESA